MPTTPTQDFSNLPRQRPGLHTKGFEHMRPSAPIEGHLSDFHRTIGGHIAGLPHEQLLPALGQLDLDPLVVVGCSWATC